MNEVTTTTVIQKIPTLLIDEDENIIHNYLVEINGERFLTETLPEAIMKITEKTKDRILEEKL